ncbi:hypothetical protein DRE_04187 [Drechslerella stenobrocha 248]|uniref:Uncharacterized protein n=1 Tax=Drechslerella stenobrocha 248 TaxID=1043628 RepID=W7HT41_9PEZI|nr:hypothetical protein DRE_04187 [Drechslerella stenobrocha 248]
MSPAPSLSDEELESEREEEHPGEVRNQGVIGAILPGFLTVASPEPVEPVAQVVEPVIQPVVEPVVEPVVGPVVEPVEEDVPESPRIAQIAAGHTPPALDIKPIFPHRHAGGNDRARPAAQPAAEAVVLPNIAEVVTEQSEEVEAAGMQAAGPLPEEVIGEGDERPAQTQTQNILSPKPIKLVSAGLIAAGLTPAHTADQSVAVVGAQNGVSKPDVAITGTTAKKASAKPKTGLSEPKHAPKAKHAPNKVVPVPSPATANGGKLKKLRQATSPAPQRLSVDSDASESSFKREKPRRRAQEGGGFARMSMRDGNGVVPASASARRGSGDRPSRMIGTGGPRRRDWSPDTSDDDRSTVLTKSGKKGGGFLGKATLRGGSNNRPHSSLGLPPSTTGSGFRSRFEDSSDDEDAEPTRMLETMRTHSAVYRPLTPDSSDGEEEEVRRPATAGAAGSGASESFGKRTPVYASAGMFGYTTSISAGVAPKKKWWSFGSKRKQKVIGVSSATYVPGPTEEPDLVVVGESLPGRTWTPSLGTSTLAGEEEKVPKAAADVWD